MLECFFKERATYRNSKDNVEVYINWIWFESVSGTLMNVNGIENGDENTLYTGTFFVFHYEECFWEKIGE